MHDSNFEAHQSPAVDDVQNMPRRKHSEASRPPRLKRYPCDMCHRWFDRPSSLSLHILSHTGEKPHACSRCGARFASTSNLNRHVRTCGTVKWARNTGPANFAPGGHPPRLLDEDNVAEADSRVEIHMGYAPTSQSGSRNERTRLPSEPSREIYNNFVAGTSSGVESQFQYCHSDTSSRRQYYDHKLGNYPDQHTSLPHYQNDVGTPVSDARSLRHSYNTLTTDRGDAITDLRHSLSHPETTPRGWWPSNDRTPPTYDGYSDTPSPVQHETDSTIYTPREGWVWYNQHNTEQAPAPY